MSEKPLRILLADDDEDDYIVTRDLLSDITWRKYELEWVPSYERALERIRQAAHDVYLVDYRLGPHTGLDLLREMCAGGGCHAPIILLTGQGDKHIDLEAMNAGASDYLVKGTLDAAQLERAIRYAVERHRAAEKLLERERLAAIGETMAEVTHSMKNLFAALNGATEMLQEGIAGRNWADCEYASDLLSRSSTRLFSLITNMLDVSKQRPPQREEVQMEEVLKEVVKTLQAGLKKERVSVSSHTGEGAEVLVCDREGLFRSLMNLGLNSVDAISDTGSITITTRTAAAEELAQIAEGADTRVESQAPAKLDPAARVYLIEVADTGSGISSDRLPQIFQSFFSTKGSKGTGLGLASIRQFVELQPGNIYVRSQSGQGTAFILALFNALPQSACASDGRAQNS